MESRPHVVQGLQRLKGMFFEVPEARLTLSDAAVVSGLDRRVCEAMLGALEDARFLQRDEAGNYRRRALDSQ